MDSHIQFIIKKENLDKVKTILENFCINNVNWKNYIARFKKGNDDISYMLSFLFYTKPIVTTRDGIIIYYLKIMFDPFPVPDPYLEPIYYEELVELIQEMSRYLENTQTTIFDCFNHF